MFLITKKIYAQKKLERIQRYNFSYLRVIGASVVLCNYPKMQWLQKTPFYFAQGFGKGSAGGSSLIYVTSAGMAEAGGSKTASPLTHLMPWYSVASLQLHIVSHPPGSLYVACKSQYGGLRIIVLLTQWLASERQEV